MKLKDHLIIAVIGLKGEGKTTTLCFIADCLHDMKIGGLVLSTKNTLLKEMMEKNGFTINTHSPRVVLYDDITSNNELQGLLKYNTILIRVRGKSGIYPAKDEQWIENAKAHLYLRNEDGLRRFEFAVRDAVNNLVPELKQWKEAIE